MFNQSLRNVTDNLTDECVKILTSYRKHCASSTAPGQVCYYFFFFFILIFFRYINL